MNIKNYLIDVAAQKGIYPGLLQLPEGEVDPQHIKVVMINEVVPRDPDDWFYSNTPAPENRRTAFGLFERAGVTLTSMEDAFRFGIYITAALKTPKEGYTADPAVISEQLPLLESELSLFPNLKVIMLMGDVAKKTVNMITKAKTRKNVIPSGATGRIRHNEYYWGDIRVFPTYIMTGKNLLIEPFKRDTVVEDIRRMREVVNI